MFVVVSVCCCAMIVRFVLLFCFGVVGSYCFVAVVYVLCWLVTGRVRHAGCYVIVSNDAAVYHLFVGVGMDRLSSCIYRFFLVVLISRSCSSPTSSRRPILFAPSCPVLPGKQPLRKSRAENESRVALTEFSRPNLHHTVSRPLPSVCVALISLTRVTPNR